MLVACGWYKMVQKRCGYVSVEASFRFIISVSFSAFSFGVIHLGEGGATSYQQCALSIVRVLGGLYEILTV